MTNVPGTPSGAATPTGLQIGLGRKQADTLAWLASPSRLAIVFDNGGQLDSLVAGKNADANSIEMVLGPDTQFATLKKGTGYTGKLKLKYPGSDSRRTRTADLSATSTSLRGIGRLDGFSVSDIAQIETAGGSQEVGIVGQSNVVVTTGAGEDVLIAGGGASQTLQGEGDSDTYVLEATLGNQNISIVEAADGGEGDKLDLTKLAGAATVDIHPVLLTTNAQPPAGSKGIQLFIDAGNQVADIAHVEGIKSQAAMTYKFHDDWGYSQSTQAEEEHVFTIEAAANSGTLNFEAVTHDLQFELLGNGEVNVTATQTHGTTTYRYLVKAEGITSIKGGTGRNTYSITRADSLAGAITTPAGGTNVLDYSGYQGARPVVVDFQQKSATGLLTSALNTTPTHEVQQLAIANAIGGSFVLSLGTAATRRIHYEADADTTAANIEAALDALSSGLVSVTAGTPGAWNIRFSQAVDVPELTATADSLVPAAGQTATATIATTPAGVGADAANGIDRIDAIEGGQSNGQSSIILGSGGVPIAGGVADDVLIVSTSGSELLGLAGNDLLVGGAGPDRLSGNAGHDVLAGGAEDDLLSGGPGNDTLLSGSGSDRLLGEAGNDHLIAESGGGDLFGGAGNDVIEVQSGTDVKLYGGPGDDTFQLQNNWGTADIYEFKDGGSDTLSFADVTQNLTHVLNQGELITGTSEFTPDVSSWQRYLTATGNSSGTFAAGGNQLRMPLLKKLHPTQEVQLGNAKSGSFTLTFDGLTTDSLNYNVDADELAKQIETALNAKLASANQQVRVTKGPQENRFRVQFVDRLTVPPLITLDGSGLLDQPSGGSAATGLAVTRISDGQELNEVQQIDLSVAGRRRTTSKSRSAAPSRQPSRRPVGTKPCAPPWKRQSTI